MDKIAVLIPCYNEGQTIAKVVKDYREALPEATIYVYDNNSSDHTDEIAREAGAVVRYEYQQGKGNVIRSMFRDIDAECYVMTDGDDTYPAEDARKLADQILQGKADMVIGDRLSSTYFTENKRPFHNTGNRLVRGLINLIFKSNIKDIMTVTLYTLGVLLVAVSALLFLRFWPRRSVDAAPPAVEVESPAVSEELAVPEPQPVVTTLRFSATGDNLIHEPIYSQAARRAAEGEGYSFDYCYMNLLDFYAQQDINWINQETLCSKELAPSTYPCFSTPGECAEALYRAGFRVFSLSNNHTYDKGAAGIAATLRFWETMPEDVITTGLWKGEADYGRIPIQTVDGVKIAYLSYTEHTNGIPRNSKMTANIIYTSQQDVMEQQVRAARQEADFVVVGVHWGVEDSHNITQAQRTLAQSLADWGADVIIGTHPHVLQDAEWRTAADGRNVFVAYSLGNFLSTQSKPDQLIGAILTLELEQTTEPDGSVHCAVRGPKLHVTVTHYDAGKSNVRTYLFRDYTPELAQAHGVRAAYPSFGYDYIRQTAQTYINSEFLELA